MLKPGDRLPALALQDESGATRTLADLARLKGLVLYVYLKAAGHAEQVLADLQAL